jgi:hypothetical protein
MCIQFIRKDTNAAVATRRQDRVSAPPTTDSLEHATFLASHLFAHDHISLKEQDGRCISTSNRSFPGGRAANGFHEARNEAFEFAAEKAPHQ